MTPEETTKKEINLALAFYFSKIEDERQKAADEYKALKKLYINRGRSMLALQTHNRKLEAKLAAGADNEDLVALLRARVEELQETARQLQAERDAARELAEDWKPRLYFPGHP